jgi:hypothetical protein
MLPAGEGRDGAIALRSCHDRAVDGHHPCLRRAVEKLTTVMVVGIATLWWLDAVEGLTTYGVANFTRAGLGRRHCRRVVKRKGCVHGGERFVAPVLRRGQ